MQSTFRSVAVVHTEMAQFIGIGIVREEAQRVNREEEFALSIVGNRVNKAALERCLKLILSGKRVVGIKSSVGTKPITAQSIAIYHIRTIGRGRMSHQTARGIEPEDTVILYSTPGHTVVASTDRAERTACTQVLIDELPRSERRLVLGNEQQTATLTTNPQVLLIILEQRPDSSCVQIQRGILELIAAHTSLATWHPPQTIAHGADIQVACLVALGGTQQQVLTTHFAWVDIVGCQLSVAIVKQSVIAHYQHAALVTYKTGYHTVRRQQLLDLTFGRTADNGITMTRFPEIALLIDKNVTKIVVIGLGVALNTLRVVVAGIYSVESVTGSTNQQMVGIFLNDGIDTRYAGGTFHLNRDKLVGNRIEAVETQLGTHPESAVHILEQIRYHIAAHSIGVTFLVQIVGKTVTVVFVQTILGTNPDVAVLILAYLGYLVTRQFL